MKKKIGLALFWAFALPTLQIGELAATPVLTINQTPTVTITSANLSGGAGSDLTPSLASSSMTLVVTISESSTFNNIILTQWACYFSIGSASSNWPSNLPLSIKLSDQGSSNATSSTGGSYVVLTGSQQKICQGSGNGSNITFQCQLGNLSLVNCPPTTSAANLPISISLQAQ